MGKRKNKINKNIQKELRKQYVIAYYKRNPDIFVERELEVQLYWWQKKLLKFIFRRGFKDDKGKLLQNQENSNRNQE